MQFCLVYIDDLHGAAPPFKTISSKLTFISIR